jgi:hypothetical protein
MAMYQTGSPGASRSRYGARLDRAKLERCRHLASTRAVVDRQSPGAAFTNVGASQLGETRPRAKSGLDGPINPRVRTF